MIEEVDQRARACDVAAEHANRLRQRADLDVHTAMDVEVIDRSAAVLTEHAARVRIVDHHDAAELLGQRAQRRQRPEVAVHAEDAVRDEQRTLSGRQRLQDLSRGVDVLVREHLDGRPAQPAAVDDARVIQLVRHNHIVFA